MRASRPRWHGAGCGALLAVAAGVAVLAAGSSLWLLERNRELVRDAAAERAAAGAAADSLASLRVFLLPAFRSDPAEPSAVLPPEQVAGAFALAVDTADAPRIAAYRVSIEGAEGSALFRRGGLVASDLEVVVVGFPGGFFAPGDYRLTLEGVTGRGEVISVSRVCLDGGAGGPGPERGGEAGRRLPPARRHQDHPHTDRLRWRVASPRARCTGRTPDSPPPDYSPLSARA